MWRGKFRFDPEAILFSAVLVNTKRDLWASYNWYTDIGNCVAFNVAKLYFQYKKRGAQPYWDTLCQCGSMQASDLRIKYFALIGISSGLQYELVDYSKSLGGGHAQVGYICLSGLAERGMPSSGLDLLTHGHYRDHLSLEYGIASWVPGLISRTDSTEQSPKRTRQRHCAVRRRDILLLHRASNSGFSLRRKRYKPCRRSPIPHRL